MSDASGPVSGCVGLILILAIGSCMFGGGDEETPAPAPVATASTPVSARTETTIGRKSKSQMTEAERLALVDTDPEMKQASDFLGFLINSNGYLCAKISNVELVNGTKYEVTCVEYRSGAGSVRYLVDGSTNEVVPL